LGADELKRTINKNSIEENRMDYNVIGQREQKSDKAYKKAFIDFIKSKQWHWFITIPIGLCDDDDVVLTRLRAIEATLCGKYLVNRYNRLPDESRFSMVVGFEGDTKCGTRHAHILAYIPSPTRRCLSHRMLMSVFPFEFRFLWNRYAAPCSFSWWSEERNVPYEIEDQAIRSRERANPPLRFGGVNVYRIIYAAKNVPGTRSTVVSL